MEYEMRATADGNSRIRGSSAIRFAEQKPQAFLLRLQEPVRTFDRTGQAIEMGTSTFTEVRREAPDSDPHSLSYFAIERETC